MSIKTILGASFLMASAAACSSAPFGYAEDRCVGQQNQCQTDCAGLDDGPARSACIQRCYATENRCYASGHDGSGSALSIDQAVGEARTQAEKEAAYEAWRAKRQRERAASGESDVDIKTTEPKKD